MVPAIPPPTEAGTGAIEITLWGLDDIVKGSRF